MLAKLKKTGRGAWLDQEMERLADPAHYINDPDQSWKRVRISGRKPEALGRWKALARWRELEAQGKDLPRGRIMKDETLAELALPPPKKQAELARVRGLSGAAAAHDRGGGRMSAPGAAAPRTATETQRPNPH